MCWKGGGTHTRKLTTRTRNFTTIETHFRSDGDYGGNRDGDRDCDGDGDGDGGVVVVVAIVVEVMVKVAPLLQTKLLL